MGSFFVVFGIQIAFCILASISACSGSLARGMVVVVDDYFNLVGGYARLQTSVLRQQNMETFMQGRDV